MLYPVAPAVLVVFLLMARNLRCVGGELYAPRPGELGAHAVGSVPRVLIGFLMTWLPLRRRGAGHRRAADGAGRGVGAGWYWVGAGGSAGTGCRWNTILLLECNAAGMQPLAAGIRWLVPPACLFAPVMVGGRMA